MLGILTKYVKSSVYIRYKNVIKTFDIRYTFLKYGMKSLKLFIKTLFLTFRYSSLEKRYTYYNFVKNTLNIQDLYWHYNVDKRLLKHC